ncbi:hypothetical protein ACI2L4_25270 [Streptomyces sparsogenes]|uniref:hypothetical protein n=1 Tax=Streptomyces sparsogenes TaxID=67365 RepID=UPI00384E8AF8
MKKMKFIAGRLRGGLSAFQDLGKRGWEELADRLESPEWWWEVGTTVIMSAVGCLLGLTIAFALYR